MKRIFVLFVCLTILSISVVCFGQDKAASKDAASEIPPGPSMEEITAWLERNLPSMGLGKVVTKTSTNTHSEKYEIKSAILSECRLIIRETFRYEDAPNRATLTQTITLKDVDLSKLVPSEIPVPDGQTKSKPSYRVPFIAISDRGKPFFVELDNGIAGKKSDGPKPTSVTTVRISNKDMADRAAIAFHRAAVLCGAPSEPVETGFVAGQSPSPKPEVPTNSKITNDEVIQLVKAGLSEQVVITSIRQAPTKDFDLTTKGLIELKKAGVSDAVILVMQERGAPTQNTSAIETKTPPKYDATLADPPKSVAAPAPQDGCAGIEMMGLFKNEIFDRAMGGGITEWLVKIRNNTAVTKIVIFGWRDQYGQEQTSQVQIRGGEIASPRVDMTQARYIAPATDVKLVSCQ